CAGSATARLPSETCEKPCGATTSTRWPLERRSDERDDAAVVCLGWSGAGGAVDRRVLAAVRIHAAVVARPVGRAGGADLPGGAEPDPRRHPDHSECRSAAGAVLRPGVGAHAPDRTVPAGALVHPV